MIARIYARQSKDKKDSLSTDFQIERGVEYCKFHNIDKYETYIDKGFSAKNLKRPAIQKMFSDIENSNDKNIVIIYKYDRISRNLYDFITLTHDFAKKDTGIISLNENFDTSQAFGRAIVMQLMVFAQLEREQTGERIKDNAFDRAKLGRFMGGTPPFGYVNKRVKDENGKLYPVLVKKTDEVELLNKIFTEYIKPGMSSRKLAVYLNKLGYTTRNNKPWNSSKITRIIKNLSYVSNSIKVYNYLNDITNYSIFNDKSDFTGNYGLFTYRKESMKDKCYVMIGNHEPLIDDDIWIMANKKLSHNVNNAPNDKRGKTSILSGLLMCGKCGNKMRISSAYKSSVEKYRYFKCRGKSDFGKTFCDMPNVKVDYIEKLVLEAVNRYIDTDKLMDEIIKKRNSYKKKKESSNKQIKEKENKIEMVKNRISTLLCSFDDETTKKYIQEEIKRLDSETKKLEQEINLLKLEYGDSFNQEASLDLIRSTIIDFRTMFDKASHEQKQTMLQYLIRDIIIYEEHMKINFFEQDFSSLSDSAFCYQPNMDMVSKNKIISTIVAFDFFNNPKTGILQIPIDINTLGGKIRQGRMKKKLRINELAEIVGISNVTLSQWELNKANPKKKIKEYNKLKKFLNIDN